MDILNSALSEEGQQEQPADQATEQVTEQQEHQATGEEAAPPAESQETREETQAKGLQAALMAERRRRQELERWVAEQQQAKPQPQATEEGAPDPAKYQDNPQQYWRDLARYEARQELKSAEEQRQQRERLEAENRRLSETKAKLDSAVVKGQQKYRDFDAVINGGLAPFLTDSIREEIAASEVGEEVAYWLGKNPAEAHRLASLDGRALAREIARLETRVATPPAPRIPQTLTQARDARGQFANQAGYDGPTPLDAVLSRKT